MAEALVSAVLEQLASIAKQHVQQEWGLISGIEKKLESLASNLEAIRALLVDAEKRQIKEESVRLWLNKLKEVSYEMDVVLDEWNTAIILRSNLKGFKKVCFFTLSPFHPNQVHRVGLHRRIACAIEELNEKLDKISNEKDRFTFSVENYNRQTLATRFFIDHERPKTTSFIDVSEVQGRDTEKHVLVSKLLSESSQVPRRGHDIIPIVGMGGIGKTSLAQLVYNDERVNAHFNLKIWVCVSDPFDEIRVAKAIVEALKVKDGHKLVEFQALLRCIHESITGKRFFLVLDDVWTEDDRKWEQLEKSLRSGAIGSKILVTTRKEKVAIMMGAKAYMITLESLSDEVCWSIFSQLAFLDNDKSKKLEEIGKKIALKCKGLPLVAKTLGSLMRFRKFTKEHWEEVLYSELWELGDHVENKVFVPFLLSYYDLSPLEKRCFLYCSYFEKDHKIFRDELIKLWMAQGFLSIEGNYEKIGVDCFENLAARSLFQDFERDDSENIIGCKMHDIVHDFVMFLTKNECLNALINSKEEKVNLGDGKAFHCTLVLEAGAQIPTSVFNKKDLRTLSVRNLGSEHNIRWDLLLSLTCLRTLSLHGCNLRRLPKNIDKLIHLRYLSLRQPYKYIKLPETICNLVNLQTLELTESVEALPKGIGKLVNLRHLYLGSQRTFLPKELGKLTSLVTLDGIMIVWPHHSLFRKAMTLDDLGKLNNLKGHLHIHINDVNDVEEVERAQLKSKEGLVHLDFDLRASLYLEPTRKCVFLLEGLQPHPNLKYLRIGYYFGRRVFPGWMTSLVNLKTLVLDWCSNCEVLGPFGKLPSLEELIIIGMCFKSVGIEFLGIEANEANNNAARKMENQSTVISFPKLKKLEFMTFEQWEEWKLESSFGNGDDGCLTIMPSLVSLTIAGCLCLKPPLPAFLRETPLQNLKIWGCEYLDQYCQEGMKTEDLVKILTSPTSEPITDTVGGTDMAEATTSGGDFPN